MPESILIVDDEQPLRYMVRRLAEGMGHVALEAESGMQALEVLKVDTVALVITDLRMPGMDGLTLARELLEQDPDRPVLLMTAFADLDSARRAIGIGIYEYFTKPFGVNDVAAGINRALERRRLVLENRAYQRDLERKVEERTLELRRKVQELEARDELLRQMLSIQEPALVKQPGAVRQGFGIHSVGVLPICRREDVIALLEVGRKRKHALVGEADLEALEGFLPYVAMAVADCKLQEELSEWGGDVEEILDKAERWSE